MCFLTFNIQKYKILFKEKIKGLYNLQTFPEVYLNKINYIPLKQKKTKIFIGKTKLLNFLLQHFVLFC